MDKNRARRLAQEWTDVAMRLRDDPYRLHEAREGHTFAQTALLRDLAIRVPDNATAAVVDDNGTNPRVLAVDSHARLLYELSFLPIPSGNRAALPADGEIQVVCSTLPLDPTKSSYRTVSFRTGSGPVLRITKWEFALGPATLEFTSTTPEPGEPTEVEAIAHAILAAMGWAQPQTAHLRAA